MQLIYYLNIRGFYRKYIRGFSIRTGTLLMVIIILYRYTTPPRLLDNDMKSKRSLKEKQKKIVQKNKYKLHIFETDFLRPAACTWEAIWFGGCHVGGLESQHADGVLS